MPVSVDESILFARAAINAYHRNKKQNIFDKTIQNQQVLSIINNCEAKVLVLHGQKYVSFFKGTVPQANKST